MLYDTSPSQESATLIARQLVVLCRFVASYLVAMASFLVCPDLCLIRSIVVDIDRIGHRNLRIPHGTDLVLCVCYYKLSPCVKESDV